MRYPIIPHNNFDFCRHEFWYRQILVSPNFTTACCKLCHSIFFWSGYFECISLHWEPRCLACLCMDMKDSIIYQIAYSLYKFTLYYVHSPNTFSLFYSWEANIIDHVSSYKRVEPSRRWFLVVQTFSLFWRKICHLFKYSFFRFQQSLCVYQG